MHPEEPIFVLRAADITAPHTIINWARTIISDPEATRPNFDQATQALAIAQNMLLWQKANPHLVKIPDMKELKQLNHK